MDKPPDRMLGASGAIPPCRHPTLDYFGMFMGLKCAPRLLASGVYPNPKELTESFACYNAAWHYLRTDYSLRDSKVLLVAVGDGSTPRTAATFAIRSSWQCYSVDPRLKPRRYSIPRLTLLPARIEEAASLLPPVERAILVACHSHADLPASVAAVRARHVAVVAMPCCVPQALDRPPDWEFQDWGCWSQDRTVRVWADVGTGQQHLIPSGLDTKTHGS